MPKENTPGVSPDNESIWNETEVAAQEFIRDGPMSEKEFRNFRAEEEQFIKQMTGVEAKKRWPTSEDIMGIPDDQVIFVSFKGNGKSVLYRYTHEELVRDTSKENESTQIRRLN